MTHDEDRAFAMLAVYGVPRERAKNIANGISVLVTRMDKDAAFLRADIARYRAAFAHTHVAGKQGDLDRCEQCGLDLRDEIHARVDRGTAP